MRFTPPQMIKPTTTAGGASRLMHLDALRGLFLLMMAMDHIPSDLQLVTNHPWGFVSAAEGFVFLAGLVGGMVYTRKLALAGAGATRSAIRHRAGVIYRWHVAIYLVILAAVSWSLLRTGAAPGGTPPLMSERPILALLAGPALLHQPGMMDILPLYFLLFLLLPWVLRLLEHGHRRWLLLGSVALWCASNLVMPQQPIVWGAINTGAFTFGAWQLLFIAGVCFGHARARGEQLLPPPRAWILLLAVVAAGLLWAFRRHYFDPGWPDGWRSWLANKNNLAPLRLANVALLFYLGAVVLSRFPRLLHIPSLALLGRHSIAVFAVHVLVATWINARPELFAETAEGRFLATLVMLSAVFVAAGLHLGAQRLARGRAAAIPRSPPVRVGDIGAA